MTFFCETVSWLTFISCFSKLQFDVLLGAIWNPLENLESEPNVISIDDFAA